MPAANPVPESGMASGELDASETMLRLPLTVPADVGAKITLNPAL